jgi:hypothetical protein
VLIAVEAGLDEPIPQLQPYSMEIVVFINFQNSFFMLH